MHFIVLSSSRGTTFQAVLDALKDGTLTATCLGLVTDAPDRPCIGKAQAAKLPVQIVGRAKVEDRGAFDQRVDGAVRALAQEGDNPPGVLLAEMGWMWIHTPWFIRTWKNRILNVHPALLPKYGGRGMYGDHVHAAVLKAGERLSGATIHLMDEGVDTGPILLQETCGVGPGETPETLKAKVQEIEKKLYPAALQMIETGEIQLPKP